MSKSKLSYGLLVAIVIIFLVYIAFMQLMQDPQADVFLGFKTRLNHPLNVPFWLIALRVHVAFAAVGMISGAINFSKRTRQHHPRFHRWNGYLYVVTVMMVGLTSGYMAPYATGGRAVSIAFNILTMLWPAFTLIAIIQIRKHRLESHRKWMIRSYAYCFTNMTVHLLTFAIRSITGWSYPVSYSIGVYAAIPLLFITAEVVIRTQRSMTDL